MQTNILWKGRADHSLENCLITETGTGTAVQSVIIGKSDDALYRVDYIIRTNEYWETIYVQLKTQLFNKRISICYESDGKGFWQKNGLPENHFRGCRDVDISLTPFTNTLPVRRLALPIKETHEITVLYFDILEQQTMPVRQKYTRLSKTQYRFENIPNDFEAIITMDENGFVVDYPGLYERTDRCETGYTI